MRFRPRITIRTAFYLLTVLVSGVVTSEYALHLKLSSFGAARCFLLPDGSGVVVPYYCSLSLAHGPLKSWLERLWNEPFWILNVVPFDPDMAQREIKLPNLDPYLEWMEISPSGARLVLCENDSMWVGDLTGDAPWRRLMPQGQWRAATPIAYFDPSETRITTPFGVWSIASGEQIFSFDRGAGGWADEWLCVSFHGGLAITHAHDRLIFWRTADGSIRGEFPFNCHGLLRPDSPNDFYLNPFFCPDGNLVVDQEIFTLAKYDAQTGQELARIATDHCRGRINRSANGRYVTIDFTNEMMPFTVLHDLERNVSRMLWLPFQDEARKVSINNDGLLACMNWEGTEVQLIDGKNGKLLAQRSIALPSHSAGPRGTFVFLACIAWGVGRWVQSQGRRRLGASHSGPVEHQVGYALRAYHSPTEDLQEVRTGCVPYSNAG